MSCPYQEICGGCVHRSMSEDEYRQYKINHLSNMLQSLSQKEIPLGEPIFIGDGVRRRASFAFQYHKGILHFGFNRFHSSDIIDIQQCPLMLTQINNVLPAIRDLLQELCSIRVQVSGKKQKKATSQSISVGDVFICSASNGLDIVLEFDADINLEHRMVIFEWAQKIDAVIRISHRRQSFGLIEPLIEKAKPQIIIGGSNVYIPAGTFLQVSDAGEKALTNLVLKYLGDTRGKIADLFCGVGTFSYPLASLSGNKIISIDSSHDLLVGFRNSVNLNMLNNIEIFERNLFKYPLADKELSGFSAIVFDPPRSGAIAQVQAIASLSLSERPSKIIAVSCNPHSFVKDAEILLEANYTITEITLVDQFAYSNHSEIVALFTLKN